MQWRKAKNLNYKHVIVIYETVIVDLPSQIAYGSSQKNPSHSNVVPPFNTNVPNVLL